MVRMLMTLMVLILGILETKATLKVELASSFSSSSSSDPELTVEEVCTRTSNESSCLKIFGLVAQKNHNKATLSYYVNEGAKMARVELNKAYKFSDTLKPKALQITPPSQGNVINFIDSCKHDFKLALDSLGGHVEGEDCTPTPTPALAPAPGSGSSTDAYEANLFFSDALTFTTTCLDELELLEAPELVKDMDSALCLAREIIRCLIGFSNNAAEDPTFNSLPIA